MIFGQNEGRRENIHGYGTSWECDKFFNPKNAVKISYEIDFGENRTVIRVRVDVNT